MKGSRFVSRTPWILAAALAALAPTGLGKEFFTMPTPQDAESSTLRFINPEALPQPPGYTHVVEARGGRTLYLAGQVALDAEGNLVGEGDVEAQAEQVFRNLGLALEAAGAGFGDVVKLGIYVTDFERVGALRDVRDRYIDVTRPPASTAVAVKRLFREEFLIEIDAVAVVAEP